MLSKEKFVDYLMFIEQQDKKQDALCTALEACTDGCYVDAFIYGEYENMLLDAMIQALLPGLPKATEAALNEDIGFFICDAEFGRSKYSNYIIVDNKKYDLTSPEKLYDYLLEVYCIK